MNVIKIDKVAAARQRARERKKERERERERDPFSRWKCKRAKYLWRAITVTVTVTVLLISLKSTGRGVQHYPEWMESVPAVWTAVLYGKRVAMSIWTKITKGEGRKDRRNEDYPPTCRRLRPSSPISLSLSLSNFFTTFVTIHSSSIPFLFQGKEGKEINRYINRSYPLLPLRLNLNKVSLRGIVFVEHGGGALLFPPLFPRSNDSGQLNCLPRLADLPACPFRRPVAPSRPVLSPLPFWTIITRVSFNSAATPLHPRPFFESRIALSDRELPVSPRCLAKKKKKKKKKRREEKGKDKQGFDIHPPLASSRERAKMCILSLFSFVFGKRNLREM